MMIPFLKQEDLILDNSRQIIPGAKIEVFDPVSNNYVDIYTYDGSNERYTVATNPVYLNLQSRPEYTYFAKQLVLCRLYKYIGNFSDPRVDDDTNNWQFIREWNGAFQQDTVKNDTIVIGLAGLKEANTELGAVNVVGYWNEYDCEARTYVWDANCVQTPDNGYIVKNDSIDTGRWILKFDGEYLPSTYYGVYPGHEANVNALLTYVDTVGSDQTKTAPGVYFVPGHYKNTTWLNTSKKILLDADTQFDYGISCSWIDVKGTPSNWIGDIMPYNSSCPVHSSWYRTAKAFFVCDSRQKYCDGHNWDNNSIDSDVANTDVTFYTNSDNYLNVATGDYRLTFKRCTVVGDSGFLYRDSRCRFIDMHFTDKYYFNSVINPDNVEFLNSDGMRCVFDADEFDNLNNLAKTAYKCGITELDLKGHNAQVIDATEYMTVKNGTINELTIGKSTEVGQYTLKNVQIGNTLTFNGQVLSIVNSSVRLNSFSNLNSLFVSDNSTVRNGWTLNRGEVRCVDSTWSMDTTNDVTLTFDKSIISSTVNTRNVAFYHSHVTNGANINVYPLTIASPSSHYAFQIVAENSVFDSDIAFVPDDLYDIYWNVKITNNTFNGAQGLTCPYWVDVTTSKRTIAEYTTSGVVHSVDYAGNRGNCPKDRYTGQIDCSLTEWANWNPSWMRGKSNSSENYKVSYRTFPRLFLVENSKAIASPIFTRADDCGFGMLLGTNTNMATVSLINLSEMIADSQDSDFIAWRDANGYTPENVNDYFMRCRGLAEDAFNTSNMYYFW